MIVRLGHYFHVTNPFRMVILHVKTAEERNSFLYETSTSIEIKSLTTELSELHNLRLKILRLADACDGLAKHGPQRPEESRGLSDEVAKMSNLDIYTYGKPTNPDPTGYRYGVPPSPEASDVLRRTADEARIYCDYSKASGGETLTLEHLEEKFLQLKGAVMIAYPAFHNLPKHDKAREILEECEDFIDSSQKNMVFDPKNLSMWWAGREMLVGSTLSDYTGKNEKTKIIVRLHPKSAGAPIREPRLDEGTYKVMMEMAYRRRKENEEFEKDEDDSYLNSEWADPKSLKNFLLNEGRPIKWRP